MTEDELAKVHEELSQYEKWMNNFRIVGSGAAGHTRKPVSVNPTEEPVSTKALLGRLAEVRGIVENFRITGEGVSGSFQQGYKVSEGTSELSAGGTSGISNTIPPPPVGACCHSDGSCTLTIEVDCDGDWLGLGTVCTPNPCPPPLGACCYSDGSCLMQDFDACESIGGIWQGLGTNCSPNLCPQPGACCVGDVCHFVLPSECTTIGGVFKGAGVPCSPNPCFVPCPSTATTVHASVSGLSSCPCRLNGSVTGYEIYTLLASLSSISLTYNIGLGVWYTKLIGAVNVKTWTISHPSCDGSPLSSFDLDLDVVFYCAGGLVQFYIVVSGGSASSVFHTDGIPGPTGNPITLPNGNTVCAGGGPFYTGGSATINW